jgi:glycosyltransferase involved in cell wall biosynthesis
MIKIALLKPHHGPVGGFELVANRVEEILTGAGYDVTRHTVDLTDTDAVARRRPLERDIVDTQREFLTYLHGRDRFDGISTGVYDLVLSTSPPSYVHRHPAHLALFFHHQRIFYDLEDAYVAAGFAADPDVHAHAAHLVRDLDRERLEAVTTFLCPSDTVARRLERFNGRSATLPFHAGVGTSRRGDGRDDVAVTDTKGVLCVTRHEFPKRAELVVAAAHLLDGTVPVTCTGHGGRLAFTRDLDARLSAGALQAEALDAATLWCNTGAAPTQPATATGRVDFVGHVDDGRLDGLYASARCVVAPAYDEDYGLTAIEAMQHGRPVIVCRDGGGLTELVDDGETGLVVEPTPAAIAAAVTRLHADDDLATHLGHNGRARAAELTWSHAAEQLLSAVAATLDAAA